MYNDCRSRLNCKHFLSDPISVTKGVHQGNVLSHLLLNVFINDLGEYLVKFVFQFLHNSKKSHFLYADDSLLSTATNELQHNTKKAISINIYLTKTVSFSKNGLASFILLKAGCCWCSYLPQILFIVSLLLKLYVPDSIFSFMSRRFPLFQISIAAIESSRKSNYK